MFKSNPDYRKVVLLIFSIQNDDDLLKECRFLKSEINRLDKESKNTLIEQHENYLDYVRNEEESVIENFINK